jgi:CxxC motif-containing protein (DUF1111 family)
MRISLKFLLVVAGPVVLAFLALAVVEGQEAGLSSAPTPAPAGFDNRTNGFLSQALFDEDREVFEERETPEDGLGPVYNATACSDCHQNPVTGARWTLRPALPAVRADIAQTLRNE